MGIYLLSPHHSPAKKSIVTFHYIVTQGSKKLNCAQFLFNLTILSPKYPCDNGELGATYEVPKGLEGTNGHPQGDSLPWTQP